MYYVIYWYKTNKVWKFLWELRRLLSIDWWWESYDAYFSFSIFWATFGGKMGWPPHAPLMFWGLQTRPKSWPTWWTFWVNRYLDIMFSKFSGVNLPPPTLWLDVFANQSENLMLISRLNLFRMKGGGVCVQCKLQVYHRARFIPATLRFCLQK